MQRLIILGAVAMMLIFGGGVFAYWTYKQNRPYPVWVPIPINRELPVAKQTELAEQLKLKLCTPAILTQVSKDMGLMSAWNMTSDARCVDELNKRIFVKIGETETPSGMNPTIDVGLQGKNKERDLSGKISMRLMQDVWKILGIKPPQKSQEF